MRKSVQKRVKVCKSVRGGPAFGTTARETKGKTCGVDRQNVHPHRNAAKPCEVDRHSEPPIRKIILRTGPNICHFDRPEGAEKSAWCPLLIPRLRTQFPARDDISAGIFADSRKKICRIKNVSYLCSPEINSGSSLKFAFGEYKADKGGEKEFTFVNDWPTIRCPTQ